MRHGLFALALVVATPAAAQTDSAALAAAVQALQALHQKFDIADAAGSQLDIECRFSKEVAAACGNCLMGVLIGDPADSTTWALMFTGGATAYQQQSAFAALRHFDLAKFQAQQSGGSGTPAAPTGSAASP